MAVVMGVVRTPWSWCGGAQTLCEGPSPSSASPPLSEKWTPVSVIQVASADLSRTSDPAFPP